ncbi:thiamine pyrophosphate-dependent enzyme [Spirillospora sp. NPDC048819]|uniref:thiamine pyrophosphate-dependent enzyme n=1 Tax=Spirillospora sp. NPDC048819 TaxID=3155268 RepID=UPI0033DF3129
MNSREFIEAILDRAGGRSVAVVAPGRTGELLFRIRPARTLFVDSMGDVCPLALGIAMAAREIDVYAFETDGGLLMNLSVLPVLGRRMPELDNLRIAIIDNRIYESSGGMPSRGCPLDWEMLFSAFGLHARVCADPEAAASAVTAARPGVRRPILIGSVSNDAAVPAAAKTIDGVESSYLVEAELARLRGIERRRPAAKS